MSNPVFCKIEKNITNLSSADLDNGNNMHEISKLFSGEQKKNILSLLSAELAQRVVKTSWKNMPL